MNNLAPMKNCPGGGVQGNLNWMPGYMQHDHVLKKSNFDLLNRPPGSGWGVCRQNICYRVAAFVIPFNLIYNMTMF